MRRIADLQLANKNRGSCKKLGEVNDTKGFKYDFDADQFGSSLVNRPFLLTLPTSKGEVHGYLKLKLVLSYVSSIQM